MAISAVSAGAPSILPTNNQPNLDGNARPAGSVNGAEQQSRVSTGNQGSSESAQAINQAQQESVVAQESNLARPTQTVTSADEVLGTQLGQIIDTTA